MGSGLQSGDWHAYAACDKSIRHSSSCYAAVIDWTKASDSGWTADIAILPASDEMRREIYHAFGYDRVQYDSDFSGKWRANQGAISLTMTLDGSLTASPRSAAGYEYGASLENILFAGGILTQGAEYPLGVSKIWDRGSAAQNSARSCCHDSDVHGDAVLITSAGESNACAAVLGTAYTVSHRNPHSGMHEFEVAPGMPFPIWGLAKELSRYGTPAAAFLYTLAGHSGLDELELRQSCPVLPKSHEIVQDRTASSAGSIPHMAKAAVVPVGTEVPSHIAEKGGMIPILKNQAAISDFKSENTFMEPDTSYEIWDNVSYKMPYEVLDAASGNGSYAASHRALQGISYEVRYEMRGGDVIRVHEYAETDSIVFAIDARENGRILIEIPHGFFDGDPNYIFLDGRPAPHSRELSSGRYHIALEFEQGAEEIEISSQARIQ